MTVSMFAVRDGALVPVPPADAKVLNAYRGKLHKVMVWTPATPGTGGGGALVPFVEHGHTAAVEDSEQVVTKWNGQFAACLQAALHMTNEAFAERLGVAPRTVAAWRANPSMVPRPEMQQILHTALERAGEQARARFAVLVRPQASRPGAEDVLLSADVALLQARIDQLQAQLAALGGATGHGSQVAA
jgi:hypothetical protein